MPEKYRHEIPDRSTILAALGEAGTPAGLALLADQFGLTEKKPRNALRRRLRQMVRDGQILRNRHGDYCLLDKIDVVVGTVSAHPDGFGFLTNTDAGQDIHLSYRQMRSLLDGDRVAVRVREKRDGRLSGQLVEILERGKQSIVGEYVREHGVGFVIESGRSTQHFVVPDHHRRKAKVGDVVRVEILEYPSERLEAQGKITAVLGDPTDPGMATRIAIEQFDLPTDWPRSVISQAQQYGARVAATDKRDRVDLRDMPLVTIDGADARDFDDAVFAEPCDDGWRLVVAIADVSHYVAPDTPLDLEARRRGTSIYFVDQVVPMLPESLSNGLCSLNPRVDRLCLVCDMQVRGSGAVDNARFYRAVMRSAARLTYDEVDRWQRGDAAGPSKLKRLAQPLGNLFAVYSALAKARRRRGALDLDVPEVFVQLDDDGRAERIKPRVRNDAHRLIEECMIAANVQAGNFLRRKRIPSLFRVHDALPEERFEDLRLMLQAIGLKVPDSARTNPKALNRILRDLRQRADDAVLSTMVLRSMSKAVYQPANIGHFGLALKTYAHFTSPIRRYPDLLVHRAITHLLAGGKPGNFVHDQVAVEQLGTQCSTLERRAEEASREVESRYKSEFAGRHVGEEFAGVVSGVVAFGLFVTLTDLCLDGLLHVSALGSDYYHLARGGLALEGERHGRRYSLGDQLRVRIAAVDIEQGKVDLELVEQARSGGRTRV